jgi:hypothetical protein
MWEELGFGIHTLEVRCEFLKLPQLNGDFYRADFISELKFD